MTREEELKTRLDSLRLGKMPVLAPYVQMVKNQLGDRHIPNYSKYLDDGIALNPRPFT